jgi:hypothetical protein
MRKTRLAKWRYYIRTLRDNLPPNLPVRVVRRRLTGDAEAWCRRTINGYLIVINSTVSYQHAIRLLNHEWAHAIEWEDRGHGAAWALAYGRVYRVLDAASHELP